MRFALLLAFLGFQPLAAQTTSNPDSALASILSGLQGTPLHLQAAVTSAEEQATAVRSAGADADAAEGARRKEAGFFDPQLFFSFQHEDVRTPTSSFFAGAPVLATRQTTTATGLRLALPVGTQLELALNTQRLASNSQFAFLNPEYDAFGSLTIRQPILGGFAASARKQLNRAEHDATAAGLRRDQRAIAASSDAEQLYWDLYAATRDYAVQVLTRDRAEAFFKETTLRAKAGLVGPNQVATARSFLADQQLLLLDRAEQLDHQSDMLATLIGRRPDAGATRFLAVDDPPEELTVEDPEVLVRRARESNLDLHADREQVEGLRALASAASWEALPTVNLVGSLSGTGLSGAARPVVFNADTLRLDRGGSAGDAIRQAAGRDFPGWSIGVEVQIPIGFRSGLGERDRLDAQVVGAQYLLTGRERVVEEQVRAVHRELLHGKERLAAARSAVEAALEQVRIGMIEFHNGRQTAFELTRLNADFAVAQQRYSEALVKAAKAACTLRQLTSGGYSGRPTQ